MGEPSSPQNLEAYAPHLGSRFIVADGGATLTLVLAELIPPRGTPRKDPFELHFQEEGWSLPQGIHTLEHPALGPVAIFLTPIGPSKEAEGCYLYQAVFN